jgi:hypothetical protein
MGEVEELDDEVASTPQFGENRIDATSSPPPNGGNGMAKASACA